jgi:hypothetical protein
MRKTLVSIIAALTLACSGSSQLVQDYSSSQVSTKNTQTQVSTDPQSYASLTPTQRNQCSELYKKSENNPALFHTASLACQELVIQVAIEGLVGVVNPSLSSDSFLAYRSAEEFNLLNEYQRCTTTYRLQKMNESAKIVLGEQPVKIEESESCLKIKRELAAFTASCPHMKQTYLAHLAQVERSLNEWYLTFEARVPLTNTHLGYQQGKRIISSKLELARNGALNYDCSSESNSSATF